MQKTSNLGLNKPEGTDVVNIEDLNANADILDAKLGPSGHSHDGTAGNGPKIAYSNITGTPNAFGNVKVGSTTIQADSKSDTLEIVNGANITVTPDATNDRLTIAVTGTVPSATTAKACTGNAATATKLATARAIALTGDVTGSATFDGSGNTTINATVQDDSHNHVIGNIDGLQAALNAAASDAGHSFAENGYQKLSSGLIIQWGYKEPEIVNAGTAKKCTITLPNSFPNACLNVIASGRLISYASDLTQSSFALNLVNVQGGITSSETTYWQAIGY